MGGGISPHLTFGKAWIMTKTRRLSDLYAVGKEITLDDGQGAITVYLRKINQLEHEEALRRANAFRARVTIDAKDPDSLVASSIQLRMDQLASRDDLVNYLTAEEVARNIGVIEAEVSANKEWADEDYLQGLRDSWLGGLALRFQENNEDPEAKRVFTELEKFQEALKEAVDAFDENARSELNNLTEEALREKAYESFLSYEQNIAWVKEFRHCEIWFAVRESATNQERYFNSREEVDTLDARIYLELVSAYQQLSMEPTEGKSSPETPAS